MGDEENNFQPSKKRAAGVQLSRDNPGLDDDETSEPETGSFKRASDEVLASRRILKVRRNQTSTPSVPASAPAPSSNPFAAIRLVPPPGSAAAEKVEESGVVNKEIEQNDQSNNESMKKVDESKDESTVGEGKTDIKDENVKKSDSEVDESKAELNAEKDKTDDAEPNKIDYADEKAEEGEKSSDEAKKSTEIDNSENDAARKDADGEKTEENGSGDKNIAKGAENSPFSSFRQLSSSQNAFTGITGTGFSSSTFSFGSIPKDGSSLGSGSQFGLKNDVPSFGLGASGNGSSSLFGTSGPTIDNKSAGNTFPSMQEVPVETGEENEQVVFTADSALFEFIDGAWKERGKGELKVNVSTGGIGKARLIMRTRGNYRLILNAGLFPDMKLTNMDKKGVTFACVNTASEGKDGLSTFALKFKDPSIVEEFRAAVTEHKGKAAVPLKTPENSP